ncbi:MAG: sporulation protein YjcZ [Bacilli bacterium]|nr:sporulation protein YjcZ [Bacilli bacterium]
MSGNNSYKGSNGFLVVIVLYILLAIIIGSAFFC